MSSTKTPGFAASATLTPQKSAWNGVQTLSSATRPVNGFALKRGNSANGLKMSAAFTSIGEVLTDAPVTLPEELSLVIKAVYKQVFGNAYLMESESGEVKTIESEFCLNKDIREFVRGLANSETYKDRFFYSVSQYRFVELAFKHLLGRAPESKEEYQLAMNEYHSKGYESFISLLVDSIEYDQQFGFNMVPYGIYQGCYSKNELFNRSVALRLAPGQSDKGRSSLLQYCVLSNDSPNWLSISKALPAGTEKGSGFVVGGRYQSPKTNDNATPRVATKVPGGIVFY